MTCLKFPGTYSDLTVVCVYLRESSTEPGLLPQDFIKYLNRLCTREHTSTADKPDISFLEL